jgi:CRAL/TRIO domain
MCKIIVIRPGAHQPSKHQQNNVMKVMLMIFDFLYWHEHQISVYGVKAIFDLKNISLGHCFQMTPQVIKRAVAAMECYPVRIKQLQFVNAPRAVNIVLDVFRSFMSHKLRDRISVTRNNPEFSSGDNLPVELGGTGDDYTELIKYWKRTIEQNHNWFVNELS